MSATTLTMPSTHGADPLIAMWVGWYPSGIMVGVEQPCYFIHSERQPPSMSVMNSVPRARLWGIRVLWVLIAFAAYLFIAVSTSTPYVNVQDRPLLSLVTLVFVVYSYPWLKTQLVLSEE